MVMAGVSVCRPVCRRVCTGTQRSVDMVQLSHGPEVLTPTFVGHINPPPFSLQGPKPFEPSPQPPAERAPSAH